MNILQVIPQLDAGGAERTTLEVAEAIVAAGGRALVASQGGRLEDELKALGGELIRMPVATKNPFTAWNNARKLANLIRDEDIDIIHARSRAPAWSAKWAADQTSAHYVTTYHGTYNAKSALKRWYNSIMARGERVIANSQFIHDHIVKHHPFAAEKITVIPRGVDLDKFDPDVVEPSRLDHLAKSWNIDRASKQLIALYPARLTKWKGQLEMLQALGQLKADGDDLPLTVFAGDAQGRTEYVERMQALIDQFGLQDDVRLVGHCDDMPAAFGLADLVLTPSIEPEAFGRTAAEAGAMHVPVIAADHGGAREVVKIGETGWRVEPASVIALSQALTQVISMTQKERDAMGERAANRIKQRFSARALQEATLRVYSELLD